MKSKISVWGFVLLLSLLVTVEGFALPPINSILINGYSFLSSDDSDCVQIGHIHGSTWSTGSAGGAGSSCHIRAPFSMPTGTRVLGIDVSLDNNHADCEIWAGMYDVDFPWTAGSTLLFEGSYTYTGTTPDTLSITPASPTRMAIDKSYYIYLVTSGNVHYDDCGVNTVRVLYR